MFLSDWQVYFDSELGLKIVKPLNDDFIFALEQKDKKENLRLNLNTTLVFTGEDYQYLQDAVAINQCPEIDVIIKYRFQEVWRGFLNPRKGTYNQDICRVEIQPTPKDAQFCIDSISDQEVNILQTTAPQSAFFAFPNSVFNVQSCELGEFDNVIIANDEVIYSVNDQPDFSICGLGAESGWSKLTETVLILQVNPNKSFRVRLTITYTREELTLSCNQGQTPATFLDFTLLTNNCNINNTAVYSRPAVTFLSQVVGNLITSDEVEPFDPLPVDRTLQVKIYGYVGIDELGNRQRYFRARLFNDVLQSLVSECNTTIVSNFFNINPDGTAPDNDVYDRAQIEAHNLLIWQKSDIKRPLSAQAASIGNMTIKQALEIVGVFNCSYKLESGNILRIEHISYFEDEETEGEDMTTTYPSRVNNRNTYNYQDNELVKFDKFSWMDVVQDVDFKGEDIQYLNDCSENVRTYSFSRISTAMGEILENANNFSDDGFVLASAVLVDGDYIVISDRGKISNQPKLNAPLSFANLHFNYWRYERPFSEGIMNGITTQFITTKKTKQQGVINLPINPDDFFTYNFRQLIKTGLGWGMPTNITYSASSCLASFNVLHDD
jgi:hypothetical protein